MASSFQDIKTRSGYGPLASLEDTYQSSSPQDVSFPNDLIDIDHWMTFRAFETTQLNRSERSNKNPLAFISLPVPANLGTAYNIGYDNSRLHSTQQIIVDAMGQSGNSAQAAKDVLTGTAVMGTAMAAGGIASLATGGLLIPGMLTGAAGAALASPKLLSDAGTFGTAATIDTFGEEALVKAGLAQRGVARNPHRVLLFDSIDFRSHEFSYEFVPQSFAEAERLRAIIQLFKLYASPSFFTGKSAELSLVPSLKDGKISINKVDFNNADTSTGKFFFKYPEFFEIDFHHPEFLFQIGPSVLESIMIDYHPAGTPSYSRSGENAPTPTQINLRLKFTETELVTKEKILAENR